ncbi:hypothetical protein N7G274_002778 [Stereocaulon virgatum]|uniref:Uncharacterized protein n=1 Tax=Stereocaulon virgatum TaxID=373712 RepID=A0ABR4AIT0_9LECA
MSFVDAPFWTLQSRHPKVCSAAHGRLCSSQGFARRTRLYTIVFTSAMAAYSFIQRHVVASSSCISGIFFVAICAYVVSISCDSIVTSSVKRNTNKTESLCFQWLSF